MNIEDLAFLQEHVSTIDGQRLERLGEVRDRIRGARRRRAAAAIGGAAAAVLVVAIALIANPNPHARPEPAGVPGGEVLAPAPFLTNSQASVWVPRIRLANTRPPRLSHCISDPRTWGAVTTQTATYIDPHSAGHHGVADSRMNEYLLQYADGSSARRAFLDAFQQARACDNGDQFPIQRPGGEGGGYVPDPKAADGVRALLFDEGFHAEWAEASDGIAATNHPTVLRAARAGNVVVVIEDATLEDKSEGWLAKAVYQALPQYKWRRALAPATSHPPAS